LRNVALFFSPLPSGRRFASFSPLSPPQKEGEPFFFERNSENLPHFFPPSGDVVFLEPPLTFPPPRFPNSKGQVTLFFPPRLVAVGFAPLRTLRFFPCPHLPVAAKQVEYHKFPSPVVGLEACAHFSPFFFFLARTAVTQFCSPWCAEEVSPSLVFFLFSIYFNRKAKTQFPFSPSGHGIKPTYSLLPKPVNPLFLCPLPGFGNGIVFFFIGIHQPFVVSPPSPPFGVG